MAPAPRTLGPVPEGVLMMLALEQPFGIEVLVDDPAGALSRFYQERTRLANAQLADLQFKRVGTTTIWIMRKSAREAAKAKLLEEITDVPG